jgi:hypothetical protein
MPPPITFDRSKQAITNEAVLAMNAMGQAKFRRPMKTINGAAINGIRICKIGK